MNYRQVEIAKIFSEWLDRRSCPNDLRDKPKAAADEAEALLRAVAKFAPQSEYQPFIHRVLDQLDYQMKTRFWPTVNEVAAAASNLRKEVAVSKVKTDDDDEKDMSPEAITARAMMEGKPVGEGWLYGASAVAMIAKKIVDEATMTKYRSGAFLARKAAFKEPAALAWEAEAKARHETAKADWRDKERTQHQTNIPTNKALEGFTA
jgi:hypothetical protein